MDYKKAPTFIETVWSGLIMVYPFFIIHAIGIPTLKRRLTYRCIQFLLLIEFDLLLWFMYSCIINKQQ